MSFLQIIIPGLLAGISSGLVAWGGIQATVRTLVKRVAKLEDCHLEMVRALGRLEGREGINAHN